MCSSRDINKVITERKYGLIKLKERIDEVTKKVGKFVKLKELDFDA